MLPSTIRIGFGALPDGTLITSDLILKGDEYLAQGIRLAGAPEPSDPPYCADATVAAVRYAADGIPFFLTTARPGDSEVCNTVPVAITFVHPVRRVTLTFFGASTIYTLQAYDSAGALLGTVQQEAVYRSHAVKVTFRSANASISRVIFGKMPVLPEPALTAISAISYEQ